jgi:hypothetical protein
VEDTRGPNDKSVKDLLKQISELEQENRLLRRLLIDTLLEKVALQDSIGRYTPDL